MVRVTADFRRKMRFRVVVRVGRERPPVMGVPEEWSSIGGNVEDKTRLIGRLALTFCMRVGT